MSVTVGTPVSSVMTNKRRVGALKSLGVLTVGDALTYYPFRVTDPVPLRSIREARIGEPMAFAAEVRVVRVASSGARGNGRLEVVVDDSAFAASRRQPGAIARLVFFSHKKQYLDWMSGRLRQGTCVVVAGMPGVFNDQLQFTHPEVLTVGVRTTSGHKSAPQENQASDSITPSWCEPVSPRPDVESPEEGLARVCRPRPVYHASSRISSDHIHDSILDMLRLLAESGDSVAPTSDGAEAVDKAANVPQSGVAGASGTPETAEVPGMPEEPGVSESEGARARLLSGLSRAIPDILPERIRADKDLMHRAEAFLNIHDPVSTKEFHRAIATLRYEEAFVCQTALLQARAHAGHASAEPCPDVTLRDAMIASLPFNLTGGQREVIDSIAADISRDHPMQRLLQGEVGSGKTVVALAAMLQAVGSGHQAVLVAPTQVLAEQHHRTIAAMVDRMAEQAAMDSDGHPLSAPPVILLTGGMKLAARRRALATAASGEPCIVVATHAAFSKTFQAPNLALAVIDEQHRFGVEQRESLRGKALSGKAPHLLVMTATPIPRTAAMTWFGDLDISWLTELPGGRKPIRTFVVPETDGPLMGSMFAHIRQRIDAGERAYVVCARIDESDDAGEGDLVQSPMVGDDGSAAPTRPMHTVMQIAERLGKLPQFAGVRFATLTGRDDDATKQQVMAGFASGETPILVATTVIEVGVDVPQASCIVVFDADRFGLSQLHQLRGRVGRGGTPSWSFLVSQAEPGSLGEQRLAVIRDTTDGSTIAEEDLRLRGAGDVLGDAQSGGKSSLKLLRVVKDAELIVDARERAEALLAEDPELDGEVELAGAVLDFTRGNETYLTSS
ncbi:ATP-dependent DNA helicase RecG [Bifidobacterium pullorum subsp. saeculare]|uniref:ATP-dependent DNA helicase RecG n=1 Tax=Bifidobacterium pullorum TaxID=78448 RepID=UPI0019570778|nr:ATP-dependent DNA helicase RecG [Bifidobacterium pullorum]MBM6730373.1 ATP-dependent DNA helicase RecG [Bifidobacterium pullorum subsp. saeculare]